MEGDRILRISKACESCRRRKTRCDGVEPCRQCRIKQTPCSYRLNARSRPAPPQSQAARPPSTSPCDDGLDPELAESSNDETETTRPEVYQSVAARHEAPQSTDSTQLFYGPSSTFAFLQQIHRAILTNKKNAPNRSRDVQEAGPGLDAFMQRSIFFGTPLQVDVSLGHLPVSSAQAREFLDYFKTSSQKLFPFLTPLSLDALLPLLDAHAPNVGPWSQRKAILLVVLAIGALSTPFTALAEQLFICAKQEAVIYEDVVTLPTIQFSLLAADYQNNIGRPNSAYLHIGQACRKAFAMGLHTATRSGVLNSEELQERRRTLWCLYFLEIWTCSAVGRKGVMKRGDISCPFPDEQPVLVNHCQYAMILEQACELIYMRKPQPLRQVYATAEDLYAQTQQWAKKCGLFAEGDGRPEMQFDTVSKMMLYNGYFYLVLISFRPFLLAIPKLQSKSSKMPVEELWIRQACRRATDAAQDCLVFMHSLFHTSAECKQRRQGSFYIETSCAVLLYDSLCHPSKHPNNKEYVQIALDCLRELVGDAPATNTTLSMERILQAVESSIATTMPPDPAGDALAMQRLQESYTPPQFQLVSLGGQRSEVLQDLMLFSDRDLDSSMGGTSIAPLNLQELAFDGQATSNPLSHLNFDVVTTDLFNFFATDNSPM